MTIRTYSDLIKCSSFEDRYRYLSLRGTVGESTFGFERYLNQHFYTSTQWRQVRQDVIFRDKGRDLGVEGYEVHGRIIIHHLNPMTVQEIRLGDPKILDLNFLISTSHSTHNAIHYGDEKLLPKPLVPRKPGDTLLW